MMNPRRTSPSNPTRRPADQRFNGWPRSAPWWVVLLLSACGAPTPAPAPSDPVLPGAPGPGSGAPAAGPGASAGAIAGAAVAGSPVNPCVPVKQSAAKTIDGYKHDVACHLYVHNRQHLYEGAPPPLLKSVTVLSLTVDSKGQPTAISVRRTNGFRELDQRAIQSVREAAPLPVPPPHTLHRGVLEFNETWLFRDDGRFQIRSLAAVQASE